MVRHPPYTHSPKSLPWYISYTKNTYTYIDTYIDTDTDFKKCLCPGRGQRILKSQYPRTFPSYGKPPYRALFRRELRAAITPAHLQGHSFYIVFLFFIYFFTRSACPSPHPHHLLLLLFFCLIYILGFLFHIHFGVYFFKDKRVLF
jgi:hypothetical protein